MRREVRLREGFLTLLRPVVSTSALLIFSMGDLFAAATPVTGSERAEIARTTKIAWQAIETLAFEGEFFVADTAGKRLHPSSRGATRFAFSKSGGGKYSYRLTSYLDGRVSHPSSQFREDGRKRYDLGAYPEDHNAVYEVVIRNQVDTDTEYGSDGMLTPLWLWIPGGRPLHIWLEQGATLDRTSDNQGTEVVLTATFKGNPLRVWLSKAHDWLPSRVQLGEGFEFRTTRFTLEQGHWFPAEGVSLHLTSDGVDEAKDVGFALTSLRINDPIPDSQFGLPPLLDGAMVTDLSGGRSYIQGGAAALRKLQATRPFPRGIPHRSEATGTLPPATKTPPRSPWGSILLAFAAMTLVTAGVLGWRQRSST